MSNQHPSDGEENFSGPTDGMAKVTLLIGQDTVARLDLMTRRGHFGGRGRTIDALLDTLHNCVDEINAWNLEFYHTLDPTVPEQGKAQAQAAMTNSAQKVWTRLERFLEFAVWEDYPRDGSWLEGRSRTRLRKRTASEAARR